MGKAEFLNPGGSVKDRVALSILRDAESRGYLSSKGDMIFEGTSGSTGISLTLAAKQKGYLSCIFLPNDQAEEKVSTLQVLGAQVVQTPACGITDPQHYCNASRREASKLVPNQHRLFADQFENLANYKAHYKETGEEIWRQTNGLLDGFVASCGTGGTLAGAGMRLHDYNPNIKIVLSDPQGSSLYNKVRYNVLYNEKDAEGHRTRLMSDTIVEGIGINRLTLNFLKGYKAITHSYTVSDLEAVHMSRYLIEHDGLFVGSSSAVNCCGLVKAVLDGVFHPGSRVVVILCDSGVRHLSRFYNSNYLASKNLLPNYLLPEGKSKRFTAPDSHTRLNSIQAALSTEPPQSVFDFVDGAVKE